MTMQIQGGLVYLEDGTFQKTNLLIENERIASISDSVDTCGSFIDAGGLYVIPGLIDIHFHGCMGKDFSDGELDTIRKIVKYERENGITTVCPSSMTLTVEQYEKIAKSVKEYRDIDRVALAGMHMEGPFLNPLKCGAQNQEYCKMPDIALFQRIMELSGNNICHITLAPELTGASEFIQDLSRETVIAIGHSTADYETANRAFQMGARQVTHLYNAMNSFHHREPGIPGAALDQNEVMVELICDGFHLHPAIVRGAFRQYGDERIVLISDSTMAAGMPDGTYTLGGDKVYCRERCVTTQNAILAGSASNLLQCVQAAVLEMNLPLETIVKCATINPAKIIKKDKIYGSITAGKYANIILLNQKLELVSVIYRGKKVK